MKIKKIISNILWISFFSTSITAYVYNLIFVLNISNFQLKMSEELIAIIGCFIPPIGVIHTFYNWYNFVL